MAGTRHAREWQVDITPASVDATDNVLMEKGTTGVGGWQIADLDPRVAATRGYNDCRRSVIVLPYEIL